MLNYTKPHTAVKTGETMTRNVVLEIDCGKKCVECGKSGATPSGICLKCVSGAMMGKQMKSPQGKIVQRRIWKTQEKYG